MIHNEPHPSAGNTVTLSPKRDGPDIKNGDKYQVEDYWDRVSGGSWMTAGGNPAALKYALRSGVTGLPFDNEVVYGKIDGFGHLVHVSELNPE